MNHMRLKWDSRPLTSATSTSAEIPRARRLSPTQPRTLTDDPPRIIFPGKRYAVFGFDKIGGRDIRVETRLPGQGVGREVFRTTEERTAIDAALPRMMQCLRAGGRVLRIWVLPDEPANSRKQGAS